MGEISRESVARRQGERKKEFGDAAPVWAVQPGEWRCYLCPPTNGMDGIPWVEFYYHSINGKMPVCLRKNNPLFRYPGFAAAAEKAKKTFKIGDCPGCTYAATLEGDAQKDAKAKTRFLIPVVPLDMRRGDEWVGLGDYERVPSRLYCGFTIQKDTETLVLREGNIADPSAAVLLVITRTGKGRFDTRYRVDPDTETLRQPLQLPKPIAAAVRKEVVDGGTLDPILAVAFGMKSPEQMTAIIEGREEAQESSEKAPPACYGNAEELEPGDEYCAKCEHRFDCAEAAGAGDVWSDEPDMDDQNGADNQPEPEPEPEPEKKADDEISDDDLEAMLAARRARRARRTKKGK